MREVPRRTPGRNDGIRLFLEIGFLERLLFIGGLRAEHELDEGVDEETLVLGRNRRDHLQQKLALLFGELDDVPEVDERGPLFVIAVVDHDVAGMRVVVHNAALEQRLVDPLPDDLLEEERAVGYGAHLEAERGIDLEVVRRVHVLADDGPALHAPDRAIQQAVLGVWRAEERKHSADLLRDGLRGHAQRCIDAKRP